MSDQLILTPLGKAVNSLEKAIQQPKDEFIRDAVIQRFENTYELCWKFMRRYLSEDIGNETVSSYSRKDLFRVAADKGLIDNPISWFTFHKARNETSHTYHEETAEATYLIAIKFLDASKSLLTKLEQLNHDFDS